MSHRLNASLLLLALAALTCGSSAQNVHIVLRAKGGKTQFHLGEPITLEAVCVDPATQGYLSPCAVVLKAAAVSVGARLSADYIDQLTWLDAQSGSLPPQPRAQCGNIDHEFPSQQSGTLKWQEVTLIEPFPVYPGQYEIGASLAYDLEMADRLATTAKHSSSDEVTISVDDNLGWKDHILQFRDCDYDYRLTLVPDTDAVSALSKHLGHCAIDDDRSFAQLLHRTIWLKLQVERPDLYLRMVQLERGQGAAPGEAKHIKEWFHDQYRRLLLQTAGQLITEYESYPELHGDDDFEGDMQDGFENWHDAAATLFGGADLYVTRGEVVSFLKQTGRPQSYVTRFLKERKSSMPGELPEYESPLVPAE